MIRFNIGVSKVKFFSHMYNGEYVTKGFFDNRISSTAIEVNYPEWTPNDDGYMYGHKVYYKEIHSVYTAKYNNIKTNPLLDSDGWLFQGDNEYKSLDQQEHSESIHPKNEDAVEIFDIHNMTHLIGMNIKGASHITIFTNDGEDDKEWTEIISKTLSNPTCFKGCCTCCDEGEFFSDRYVFRVDRDRCTKDAKIKVVLSRDIDSDRVTIGMQTVVCSRDLGCVSTSNWGQTIPDSFKMWNGESKIAKDIFYIKRNLSVKVGIFEEKAKDDFNFLFSVSKRKHFFWLEKKSKIDKSNLYENSLLFGNTKELYNTSSKFDAKVVEYNITGVEN